MRIKELKLHNFRGIKDSLGYDIGDGLLQAVAKRLSISVSNKKNLPVIMIKIYAIKKFELAINPKSSKTTILH